MGLQDLEDLNLDDNEITAKPPRRKKKSGTGFFIVGMICFLLTATMLAAVVLTIGRDLFIKEKEEHIDDDFKYTGYQVREMISRAEKQAQSAAEERERESFKETILDAARNDNGILFYLRETFPDQIIYLHGSKYEFYPINPDLAPNTIDNANFVENPNDLRITYEVNGKVKSHMMVDVSSFQKDIDWEAAAADGVEYAMIRCAFRGYESGKIVTDSYFEQNIENATKAGVKVGVYFFSQATSLEEAVEEAQYTLELIAPYKVELPVAIDVEEVSSAARTDNLTVDQKTGYSVKFMDTIKEAGYDAMIYSNAKFFIKNLNMDMLEGYDKWFAQYNDSIYFPYEIAIWQYSSKGTVKGIGSKNVDLDITFKEY